MPQYFTEGALTLTFPDDWHVVKYDEPGASFYQKHIKTIGADLTAVDFIAATPDNARLWLIEVKDFRGYAVENRKRLTSGSLAVEVMANFLDTIAGLFAGIHGRQAAPLRVAPAFQNPNVTVCATLLVATDPLPSAATPKRLSPTDQKLLAAEQKWRGEMLLTFQSRLKKPFRFTVHLFDHDQIAVRYGWSAA